MIKLGSVSQEVAAWQKFLQLPQDGIFGAGTDKATRAFQEFHGLKPVDGIVGEATYKKAQEKGFVVKTLVAAWFPPRPRFGSPTAAEREKLFGRFDWRRKNATDIQILGTWAQDNIVKVLIPQLIGVEGAPKDGYVLFHKAGAAQLRGFFAEVERQGLLPLVISWAGSFYPRFIRGSASSLSNHSWGTAFDINAPQNWLGAKPAPVGAKGSLLKLVPIANAFGFYWGGHYGSRLDGMHFELAIVGMFPPEGFFDKPAPPAAVAPAPVFSFPPSANKSDGSTDQPDAPSLAPDQSSDASDGAPKVVEVNQTVEGDNKQAEVDAAQKQPDTTLERTPPTSFGSKIVAFFAAVVTGQQVVPQFLQDGVSSNWTTIFKLLGLILQGIYDNRYLILTGLALWYIVKKANNYFLTAKIADINSDPTRGNVKLVPPPDAPKRRTLLQRIKAVFSGDVED